MRIIEENFTKLFRENIQANMRYGVLVFVLFIFFLLGNESFAAFLEKIILLNNVDYNNLYLIFSYTIIILSIVYLHAIKNYYLFDGFSLWLVVLGCLVRQHTEGSFYVFTSYYLSIIGLLFSLYILINRKRFTYPDYRSIIEGVFWAIGTMLLLALLAAFLFKFQDNSLPAHLPLILFVKFLTQMSYNVVVEEALFRGVFVVFLILNGHKEKTAFAIQAILFWLTHFMHPNSGFNLFIFVPILALFITSAVKKQKMIYVGILIHILANVFASPLAILLKNYFISLR